MNSIKELFKDDCSINNERYAFAFTKSLLIIFSLFLCVYYCLEISNQYLSFIACVIMLLAYVYIIRKLNFNFFNYKFLNKEQLLYVLAATLLITGLDFLYEFIHPGTSPNDESILKEIKGYSLIYLIFSLSLVPAIVEELIFRGFLLRIIFRNHLLTGLIFSSIIFSIMHEGNQILDYIPYFYFALIVSLTYLKTKRLEVAILIHFLINLKTVIEFII